MDCSTPGFPVLHHLPEFAQTHVHWIGDAIQPSHPLLSPFPAALNLSQNKVFSNESAICIRWPKDWSFSFSISSSSEYSELISFRIDRFDLLVVQGTFKSLLQHHNSKASILQHWAFPMVQFSHQYVTTGKTIALTIRTSVGKVMSPLFNTPSRFVIAGKDWRWEEKWKIEDEMVEWITNSMDMSLGKLRSWWWTGRPGVLQSMGSQRVRHDQATELNWTRFVIAFLPRSKQLLILWLQSLSAVISEPKKIKSVTVSIFSTSICHEVMRPDATIFVF